MSVNTRKMSVKKGGSTNIFSIVVEGVTDYTDYYADLVVLDPDTKLSVGVTRVIAPDVSTGFSVFITPAETVLLDVATYLVVLEISKDEAGTITFRRELSWPLEIKESLINN